MSFKNSVNKREVKINTVIDLSSIWPVKPVHRKTGLRSGSLFLCSRAGTDHLYWKSGRVGLSENLDLE